MITYSFGKLFGLKSYRVKLNNVDGEVSAAPNLFSKAKKLVFFACLGASTLYLSPAQSQSLTNVALNKSATQGSQYGSVFRFGPQRAIDGNYSSFNHTSRNNSRNWMEIDLGGEFNIKQVLIHNRNFRGGNRVRNVTIQFKDRNGNLVDDRYISGTLPTSSPASTYFGNPLEGISAIRIDNGGSYLHVTEVEVMGFPTSTGDWSFCAGQNQTCSVPATSSVRYGSGNTFNEIQGVNGSIACNDATFDNPGGSNRFCEYKVTRPGAYPIVGKTPNSVVGIPNWYSVNYAGIAWNPVMIAQMQTQDGPDPAAVRMKDLSNTGFKVTIEEEKSSDSEVAHTSEVVGYMGFPEGEIADVNGKVIGEAGRISFSQGTGNKWRSESLLRSYVHPIIIKSLNTFADSAPSVLQINYIGDNYFWYRLAEWDYLDGTHNTSESTSYIIIEAGNYTLASGQQLIAGAVFANGSFDQESFPAGAKDFTSPPNVFTQQQSMVEDVTYTTRMQDISTQGFKLRLEEQESSNGVHASEVVGYIAVGNTSLDNLWRHTTKHFPTTAVSNMNVADSLFNSPPSNTVTSYSKTYVINFNQTSGRNDGLFPYDQPFSRPQGTSTNHFVVESTATISVEESGNYVFGVRSDDGFRLKINGQVVARHINPRGMGETLSQPFYMSADTNYSVNLRYYEKTGGAALEFYMGGEDTNEFHLVHAGINLAPDDVEAERVVTGISSDNDFRYNVLRRGDKLIHSSVGASFYAKFDNEGDFVLYNHNSPVWSTKTGASDKNIWDNSLHHAKQCDSNLVNVYGECGFGHELKIDGLGIYVVNQDGMVIWRPDLGDLNDTDTSQGYTLKFIYGTGGRIGLENNATGHIRWDSTQGYRPVKKATTALFTSLHPEAAWQKPHTPHTSGTTTLDGNDIADYVVEEMKQQSILSYHPDESRSDVLLCFDCSTSSSTKYKAELTNQGDLRIVSTNSAGSIIQTHWNTNVGNSFNQGRVYLAVSHKGLELYSTASNSVVWQANANLPDGNYMLRLAKHTQTVPHLELWDMENNTIVWDTAPGSTNNRRNLWHPKMPQVIKDTISNIASSGQHLLSSGYNVAKFGWDHLEGFIANSAEWNDFTQLFEDAAHLRLHDAFGDLVKLEQDVVDDAERLLYDVGHIMSIVAKLASPSTLANLANAPAWHEVWTLVKHPKRLVEYVERLVDALKEAKHKAQMVAEVLQNPSDLEGIFIGAINNAMDGGRDHLEAMLLKPMQLLVPNSVVNDASEEHGGRVLSEGNANDASCDDAIDSRFCRFISRKPGFGWDISTPEIVGNFVSSNKSKFKIFNAQGDGSNQKQLNHLQVRTTLVPMSHLRDVNDDGIKELVKLRMRVQTLQITAMMDFRASTGSLALLGAFSGHTWSFPILAYDKDGAKIPHAGKNIIYGTGAGFIARGDLQIEAMKQFYGDFKTALNLDNSISTLNMADIAGESTSALGAAATSARTAATTVSTNIAATSSLVGASNALMGCITKPISCGLTGVSALMFKGMGTMVTVGSEIVTSPFAKSAGITFVATAPMRFRYVYNRMSTKRKVMLHGVEAVGALMGPLLLESYGVGLAIDEFTQNPISTLSLESMAGSTIADLLFWGLSSAYDYSQGNPPAATISGYIGGSIGLTMSFNRKAAGSSVTVGGMVRSPSGGITYGSKESAGGALLTKTRFRVRYSFSVASDGKGAEPI